MLQGRSQLHRGPERKPLWLTILLTWSQVTQVTASPFQVGNAIFDALPVSGVRFTGHVLGEQPAKSTVQCAVRCVKAGPCGTFTFTPRAAGPGGGCRIHGKRQHPQGEREPAPGARSFLRRITELWIQTACISHSDCTEPGAYCYTGHCLCHGAFFFDYYQNACEEYCTRALGDKYLAYANKDLNGVNGSDITVSSQMEDPANCIPICNDDPNCLAFIYIAAWKQCYYKAVTARDYPDKWRYHPTAVWYQKTCK